MCNCCCSKQIVNQVAFLLDLQVQPLPVDAAVCQWVYLHSIHKNFPTLWVFTMMAESKAEVAALFRLGPGLRTTEWLPFGPFPDQLRHKSKMIGRCRPENGSRNSGQDLGNNSPSTFLCNGFHSNGVNGMPIWDLRVVGVHPVTDVRNQTGHHDGHRKNPKDAYT